MKPKTVVFGRVRDVKRTYTNKTATVRCAGRSALSLRVRQGPVLVLRDGGSYISLGDGILRATRIFHYVDHKVGFPALWLGNDFRFSADTQLAPPL